MADIFLSYSRADRDRAQVISKALEAEGFSVWWDKVLRAGQTYDEVTEGMLRDSKVVVVLWSEVSVKSKWVRAEATLGERTSVLVPAMIDDAERPIMFELTQSADLIGWSEDREDPRWRQFIADIRSAVEAAAEIPEEQIQAAVSSSDANIETTFWTSIKDGSDPADFEAYLERYPEGHFTSLARNRLNNLGSGRSEVTEAPAPVTPPKSPPPPPPASAHQQTPDKLEAKKAKKKEKNKGGFPIIRILLIFGILAAGGFYGSEYFGSVEQEEVPVVCDDCPEMVVIPGGSFEMGSRNDEPGHEPWEAPQHTVVVAPFALARHEVTFDDWQRCLDDGGCNGYEPLDRDFGRGTNAVMGISWEDAQAYIRWLSQKTGRPYRLPTEAEWEYAARAGTQTAYWWGDPFDRNKVPIDAPISVLELAENPLGLKGMLGNLREWVEDCYDNTYASAPANGSAQTSVGCERRVIRGGHYAGGEAAHRSANRARGMPGVRDRSYGFRVASSSVEPE